VERKKTAFLHAHAVQLLLWTWYPADYNERRSLTEITGENTMDHKGFVPHYDKEDRKHMRRLLQKASPLIDLIAQGRVPFGSPMSARLIDQLAEETGDENTDKKDDGALEELQEDRQALINLYGAVKKEPAFLPLYTELGNLLLKYGLFDEETALLENASALGCFDDDGIAFINSRLRNALQYREADDAGLSEEEETGEKLRRALRKKPLDEGKIRALLEQCRDDTALYDTACSSGGDPSMIPIREKAARLIRSRDFRYALSSHLRQASRTAMILDLYDDLDGDEVFIARTLLTDPDERNKAHVLLYCRDEDLLMLGWLYVYGARKICAERLHAMGSRFPEAYVEMDPREKAGWKEEWLSYAAETAYTDILPEDEAVRGRLTGLASVDSEPVHLFLSMQHPRKAVRWWHARKLKNPAYIAYAGSWTEDDQIRESLSVKIDSAGLVTEMLFGDLSGADPVFGFRKPEDTALQDRFCVEIMKNHPDRAIREHVRTELLRGRAVIPGVDLAKPDPLYKKS
jgi:hypothetical protein